MTDCAPPFTTFPLGPPPNGPPPLPPEVPGTTLVLDPVTPMVLTNNRETDAVTAVRRGLAEYFSQQEIEIDGRSFSLSKSLYEWADPEEWADYPSACTYSIEAGDYSSQSFTPKVTDVLPNGQWAAVSSELVIKLVTEVWCTDAAQRTAVVAMLEDALQPVEWRNGFLLTLPHYYGTRARYEMVSVQYLDDPASAIQRFRVARIVTRADVPVIRVLGLPLARVKTNVAVQDTPLVMP